jgi:hypothetical protein
MILKVLVIICSLVLALGQNPTTCDFCDENGELLGQAYTGLMTDHPTVGSLRAPTYCLRVDDLDGSGGCWTFNCQNNGAAVSWSFDGVNTVTVSGTVFGGKRGACVANSPYTAPELWTVNTTITGAFTCCNGGLGDNLQNDLCYHSTVGTITITNVLNPQQTYTYAPEQNNAGLSFGLVNNHGNLGVDQYTAVGWFDNDDNFTNIQAGFRDWNGVVTCVPDEPCLELCQTEEACVCVGGCALTQGYWKNHNLNKTAAQQKIPWPLNTGNASVEDATICDYIDQYGTCAAGYCNINALDLIHTPPAGGNRWIQLAHQYIAAVNNVLKGEDQGGPACLTDDLQQALEGAALALSQHCTEGGVIPVVNNPAEVINCYQDLLNAFNNGFIGSSEECGPDIECPDPETERCGCTLTPGYWQSPRFTDSHFEDIPSNGSPRNHDTCHWPVEGAHDGDDPQTDAHHDTVACIYGDNQTLTWFDALTVRPLPRAINKQWHNPARHYIAAHLNFQNGACTGDCASPQIDEDCDNIRTLLGDDDIADLFIGNKDECQANGGFKLLCEDILPADGPVRSACLALCESAGLEDDDCKLYGVLSHFNEGEIGPGHCNNADGDSNPRGCCEHCPYNEVREQHLAGDVDLEGGHHHHNNNNNKPGWWDITTLVFVIVIFLLLIIFLIWLCSKDTVEIRASLYNVLANKYN